MVATQTISSATTVDGVTIPDGWSVIQRHNVGAGVHHLAISRSRPDEIAHVALIEHGSPQRLRVVLSNDMVAGPQPRTERTSSMCARTGCLVAVNGDFFTSAGAPVGGVIDDLSPLRSPIATRPHFSVASNGTMRLGTLGMTISLTTYPSKNRVGLPRLTESREPTTTTVHGLNITRPEDRIVAYTRRWGPATETSGGTEIAARIVAPADGIRIGVPTTIDFISSRSGGSRIPSNGIVLSGDGEGASALAEIWSDVVEGRTGRRATIQISTSQDAVEAVAGKPVVVRNGEIATRSTSVPDSRTMIGWTASGDLLLVTVDGKQPGRSVGLSVIDAGYLIRKLGAVEALNLDGGGSTTFVMGSRLMNRPSTSSHHERGVAVAVAILPAT